MPEIQRVGLPSLFGGVCSWSPGHFRRVLRSATDPIRAGTRHSGRRAWRQWARCPSRAWHGVGYASPDKERGPHRRTRHPWGESGWLSLVARARLCAGAWNQRTHAHGAAHDQKLKDIGLGSRWGSHRADFYPRGLMASGMQCSSHESLRSSLPLPCGGCLRAAGPR